MSDSEEITKLKRLLIEVKGENVAFRCMLPVVLAELALTSDDPPAWMRQFHSDQPDYRSISSKRSRRHTARAGYACIGRHCRRRTP